VTEGNGVKAAWIDCNHEFGQRVGNGEMGRVGESEMVRWAKSSFFLLPSSFFLLLFEGMSFVESFEALPVAHKPPVPRLVTDALGIVFGEGHFKAEGRSVGF
jgi:hypothetical protein